MNVNQAIQSIIAKYLRRNETMEERQQLYQWYEEMDDSSKSISATEAIRSQRKVKERLLQQIKGSAGGGRVVELFSYRVAAACVVFVIAGISLKYYSERMAYTPVKLTELKKVVPDYNKATITLSTGEVVDLNSLNNNQSIQVGNTVLRKNQQGQLESLAGSKGADEVMNTLKTSRSSQYSIILSDGTKVYLNADSKLSYPNRFGSGDRVVELHGEGYFEVAKTVQHSKFFVKTDRQSVEVLGTKFNINAYDDRPVVKTTLAEGSVRLTPLNKVLHSILLKPDQQAILNESTVRRITVDASRVIKWKDGFFVFDGYNTDEIVREVGKWYDIEIEYKHDKNPVEYAGNIPKSSSLEKLIQILNYSGIKVQAYRNKNNQQKLIIK